MIANVTKDILKIMRTDTPQNLECAPLALPSTAGRPTRPRHDWELGSPRVVVRVVAQVRGGLLPWSLSLRASLAPQPQQDPGAGGDLRAPGQAGDDPGEQVRLCRFPPVTWDKGRGRVRVQVHCISGPCHPPQVGGG
jgi:hypothetical protein